jgi:diguanylate cyclase (GGDEF)-like protein
MTSAQPSAPVRSGYRSWLCPTDADVQRFYEALDGINRSRRQVLLILFLTALSMTPWLGMANLLLLLSAASVGYATDRLAGARTTTVRSGAVISAGFQIMLSAGVAGTGGAESPYLPWLAVPVTMLAARYRRAVVIWAISVAVLIGAGACLFAAALGTDAQQPAFVDAVATIGLACALGAIALNLQAAEIESRQAASSDPLTGLLNRTALDLQWRRMTAEVSDTDAWLCVLICDLDHFKAVNDLHGHAAGDEVLKCAAGVLAASIRPRDRAFRVGGEEFLVLLPHTDASRGAEIGERIRASLAARSVVGIHVTVSIGVAAARGAQADPQKLSEAADAALYGAKSDGRDRVRIAPEIGNYPGPAESRTRSVTE